MEKLYYDHIVISALEFIIMALVWLGIYIVLDVLGSIRALLAQIISKLSEANKEEIKND